MKPEDIRFFVIALKILALVCISGVVILVFPENKHHILLVIAGVLLTAGLGPLIKYNEQSKWGREKATLKSITEKEEIKVIGQYNEKMKYFYPELEYEYSIDGERHSGNTISFERENIWVPETNSWGEPTPEDKRWWHSLSAGDEITIFVNPRNPEETVVYPTVNTRRRSHHLALVLSSIILGLLWLFINFNLTIH